MALNSEPRYVISIAARMVGIEAHALRYYERLGLIQPQRSSGRIRLYSEDDLDKLRRIKTLMSDFGVNLAGVEVALRLMHLMEDMQQQIEEMEARVEQLTEVTTEDIEWKEE